MTLLNFRSSVCRLLKSSGLLIGFNLFLLTPSVSAQVSAVHYQAGASAGVWVEREWTDSLPVESEYNPDVNYEAHGSTVPTYDPATAVQQYDSPIDSAVETYEDVDDVFTEEQAASYSVVKNKDFFGIDRDNCCDEWSRFCRFKDIKFNCRCGGVKANKGHLGIRWLRSADAGEDCDYCQGGCCNREKGASREIREARRDVFSSAWNKSKRGRCDACEAPNCPEEEGCTSCR